MTAIMRGISFNIWLFRQKTRDDPVGHLGRDACEEDEKGKWPERGTMQQYLDHLRDEGSDESSMKALEQAWFEYVDIQIRDKAQFMVLEEIAEVIERDLRMATHTLDESGYVIPENRAEILQKLMQKLKRL